MDDDPAQVFDPSHLRLGGALRAAGIEPRLDPSLVRVRHGVWTDRVIWDGLAPGARHAAFVLSTATQCPTAGDMVFSHAAAAAMWGMPRIEAWPATVDVLVSDLRIRSSTLVRKHVGPWASTSVRGGLTVTSAARTVVDVARTSSLATGLAAADFALRAHLCTAGDLASEVDGLAPRSPGVRRARTVVGLADPRSMSAGESLSRAQMFRLGLPKPELQVPYSDADGLIGVVDFDWAGLVGEFDGKVKYRVPERVDPVEAQRVLWLEKQREDRLRRRVKGLVRWDWAIAINDGRLLRRLAEHGLRPQRGGNVSWCEDRPKAS